MTYDEALKNFIKRKNCRISVDCEELCSSCEYQTFPRDDSQAEDVAVLALTKEIPACALLIRRPLRSFYYCSACGYKIPAKRIRNYCPECGRRLGYDEC